MDEKRILLATAISIAILIAWPFVFGPAAPPPPPAGDTAPATGPQAAGGVTVPPPVTGLSASAAPAEAEPYAEPVAAEAATSERIETPLWEIRFTNRGGIVESWRLRDYSGADGQPVEMFPAASGSPRLLALELDDPERTRRVNEALYRVERERLPIEHGPPRERVVLHWADGRGLEVRKSLEVRHDSYLAELEVAVSDRGQPLAARVVLGPGLRAAGAEAGGSYHYHGQLLVAGQGGVTRIPRDEAAAGFAGTAFVRWTGLDDFYFAALLIPAEPGPVPMSWRTERPAAAGGVAPPSDEDDPGETILAAGIPRGQLFVGPKKFSLLHGYGRDLDRAIWFSNWGLVEWVARAIFRGLLWIHENTVQNWGVAIILSTFALRLLLFPVNQYAMVSMKKAQLQMQRLQPKVQSIRAKYKKSKDAEGRARMNQELMELYRREGVNPMGGLSGCLPLLAQFPILIGFYNMLTVAIELRGAPFFGWIQDLSQKDPWLITPVLMGATMFVQQWMAMTKVKDPEQLTQQRMMLFMPVIFTVFCVTMPSGLVLYWFVNNVLGIGQQWLVNRHTERLETAAQKA